MKPLFRVLLTALALVAGSGPVFAQAWTVGAPTISWVDSPTIGFGLDTVPEVFMSEQGGDPPWMSSEPANNDQNNYTRSQWYNTNTTTTGTGEGKVRFTCNFSGFGVLDPIVAFGGVGPHDHTFFGSPPSATATFASLRAESAKSTCAGGPINRSLYWVSSWLYDMPKNGVESGGVTLINPGVTVANQPGGTVAARAKPNIVTFYYHCAPAGTCSKRIRIPNGFAFIFGVNPSDPKNTVRLGEIPTGQGWDYEGNGSGGTKRYDGWGGWQCYDVNSNTTIPPNAASTADVNPDTGFPRQWLNADGSDPWVDGSGNHLCEDSPAAPKTLIKNLEGPECVDGINLTSPTGRGNYRHAIVKSADQGTPICFNHAFWFLNLSVKEEYPAMTWAKRQRSYLSSDRMDANPANWLPNGSTAHADLITAWDSVIRNLWHRDCEHMWVNGTTGETQECHNSTVSIATPTRLLVTEASPDSTLSNDPVITFSNYGAASLKNRFGPLLNPGKVSGKSNQMKGM